MTWEKEYKKALKTNGVHNFRFYWKKNITGVKDLITFKDYCELRSQGSKNIGMTDHVGTQINIDDFHCALTLFTTEKYTLFPGVGLVQNIRLQQNQFHYANKILFYDKTQLCMFYTVHDTLKNFPYYARNIEPRTLVKNALLGFTQSYKECCKLDPLFARHTYGRLIYEWYIDKAWVSSQLGILSPWQSKLYGGYITKLNVESLDKFTTKMDIGFSEGDADSFLKHIVF